MALKLYDTMKPQGDFPAVEAEDVLMPDGTRLSESYFTIETNGTISLKDCYRGATIDFTSDELSDSDLKEAYTYTTAEERQTLLGYAVSDNGVGNDGSKINTLPEVLYIPSIINKIKVTKLAPAMFAYNKQIKQVILPEGITEIPVECFAETTNLKQVLNVSSIKSIKYGAFFCTNIEDIAFPALETIKESAFKLSAHLKTIDIGKITTVPISCFDRCTDLKKVTHNTDYRITSIADKAFNRTLSLKDIDFIAEKDLINPEQYALKTVGKYAFYMCGVVFDWSKLTNTSFNSSSTPFRMNPTLTSSDYDGKISVAVNNIALFVNQTNPEWESKNTTRYLKYNYSCAYLSHMGAYCGILNLNYDSVYPLEDICDNIQVTAAEVPEYDTTITYKRGDLVRVDKTIFGCNLPTLKDKISGEWSETNWDALVTVNKLTDTIAPLTARDLYTPAINHYGMKMFAEKLGLHREDSKMQPSAYNDIFTALQHHKYVMLNIPSGTGNFAGHAILVYGVNSNKEVLFVDTAPAGYVKLGDYRPYLGCCLLQNITCTYDGIDYCVLSDFNTELEQILFNQNKVDIITALEEVL